MRFSVVGIGKLGASLAATIAARGHEVIGADVDPSSVDALNSGRAPARETGLEETIRANRSRISATADVSEAVAGTEVTFVVVPTPSLPSGAFSNEMALAACRSVGKALGGKALGGKEGHHVVALVSTVLPLCCREVLIPALEEESGSKCGRDFGFCYNPSFIALGEIIDNLLNPAFVLIGESDARAGDVLEKAWKSIVMNDAPVARMGIENAEITKLGINTFVTAKISFANMMGALCETVPGGDVDAVSDAMGLDPRIGRRYLTGGMAFGGPCFPRDNAALQYFAASVGVDMPLAATIERFNQDLIEAQVNRHLADIEPGTKVAVLGLAYKPNSDWIEESPGVALAKAACAKDAVVVGYDPLAGGRAGRELGDSVTIADTLEDAVRDARVVLITNPDPVFENDLPLLLAEASTPVTVVDFWRILSADVGNFRNVTYVATGRGNGAGTGSPVSEN